ncbi:MAG: hypothetical protein AB1921_16065, partial [Thermodesulfobacteriota bacterium]
LGGHFYDPLKLVDPAALIKHKGSPFVRAMDALFTGTDWAERPYTGAAEFLKTGKTVKESRYLEKTQFWSRLPATVVNVFSQMQPVQVGYALAWLRGEEDGLTSLLRSSGAMVGTAYPPREKAAVRTENGAVSSALSDLADKGLFTMGPPSGTVTVHGIPMKMTRAQYEAYAAEAGRIAEQKIARLIGTARWRAMDDGEKAEALEKIVKSARRKARQKAKRGLTSAPAGKPLDNAADATIQ